MEPIERNKKRKHKRKSSTLKSLGSSHSVVGSSEKHGPKVRSSWSAAFTAAASVQPIALDEEFIRQTDGSRNTGDPNEDDDEDTEGRDREDFIGTFKISQLALDFYHSKPSSLDPPSMYHKQQDSTTTLDTSSNKVKDKKRKKKRKRDTLEKDKQDASIHSQGPSLKSDPTGTDLDIPDFPFPTNSDDHCETPEEAYSDIIPFLKVISSHLKKGCPETVIYDPYYCSGSVVNHMARFGYTHVLNKKQDCYSVWTSSKLYPQYDILLTNPPYSLNHIESLIHHLTSKSSLHKSRPWFLLLPTWVHKKDYYIDMLGSIQPFYLVPKKRYVYKPPPGFREKRSSDVHKKNSPFVSMWFIWGGSYEMTEKLIQVFSTSTIIAERCDLARSKSALRDLRRKNK